MGLFGSPNINKLKTKGNVQGLIKALNYKKNPTIRLDATIALGEIGDSLAVEPLIEIAMGNDSIDLRIKAISCSSVKRKVTKIVSRVTRSVT